MITTIIPYLLVANLPEAVWEHGAEHIYVVDIIVKQEGTDYSKLYPGVNITNELRCRQKDSEILSCAFRHTHFDFFKQNFTSGQIVRDETNNHPTHNRHQSNDDNDYHDDDYHHHRRRRHEEHKHVNLFNEIMFDVKFGKRGVQSITMAADAFTDSRIQIIKSVINLLNSGIDVSTNIAPISAPPIIVNSSNQLIHFLTAKCSGQVQLELKQFNQDDNIANNVDLQLVEGLPKLTNDEVMQIERKANVKDCPEMAQFFWSHLIQSNMNDSILLSMEDNMIVRKNHFASEFALKLRTNQNNDAVTLTEVMKMHLSAIKPAADEAISDIDNPATISFHS